MRGRGARQVWWLVANQRTLREQQRSWAENGARTCSPATIIRATIPIPPPTHTPPSAPGCVGGAERVPGARGSKCPTQRTGVDLPAAMHSKCCFESVPLLFYHRSAAADLPQAGPVHLFSRKHPSCFPSIPPHHWPTLQALKARVVALRSELDAMRSSRGGLGGGQGGAGQQLKQGGGRRR